MKLSWYRIQNRIVSWRSVFGIPRKMLGNAFLSRQQDVMDAVQRERRKAKDYGYLRSNAQIIVSDGPYITIVPVHPAFVPVPYYEPAIVFFPTHPGIFIGGAIRFGFFVTIGDFFRPWGWGYCRFDWTRTS
jgi:hypothetical protein